MQYKFKIDSKDYEASIIGENGDTLEIILNGKPMAIELNNNRPKRVENNDVTAAVAASAAAPAQRSEQTSTIPTAGPAAAPRPAAAAKSKDVRSPLPGVVLDVKVKPGDAVKRGQTLMIVEAMKMENNIESTMDGVVASIAKSKGDAVMEGDVLVVMQ